MPTDMAGMVDVLQAQNKILTSILKQFNAGLAVLYTPTVYTVAALPTTGATGQFAFASNGRKPGEGAGSGTGVPVFWNPGTSTWFSYCSGSVVQS